MEINNLPELLGHELPLIPKLVFGFRLEAENQAPAIAHHSLSKGLFQPIADGMQGAANVNSEPNADIVGRQAWPQTSEGILSNLSCTGVDGAKAC